MCNLEALVDWYRGLVGGEDRGADVLQQDDVELGDRLGVAVVILHQHFAGALGGDRLAIQLLGKRGLVIEEQPILAPVQLVVQADAQSLQVLSQRTRCSYSSSVTKPALRSSSQVRPNRRPGRPRG